MSMQSCRKVHPPFSMGLDFCYAVAGNYPYALPHLFILASNILALVGRVL